MALTENSKNILNIGVKALSEKKAENISVIDISEISSIADAIVVASGNNINQLQAMVDEAQDKLTENYYHHLSLEGYDKGGWILMDYNDVIFHIFDKESRNFYDLERLYADGNKLDIDM